MTPPKPIFLGLAAILVPRNARKILQRHCNKGGIKRVIHERPAMDRADVSLFYSSLQSHVIAVRTLFLFKSIKRLNDGFLKQLIYFIQTDLFSGRNSSC